MSDIAKELRASVSLDAVHGDLQERMVCASQMSRAATEIERLQTTNDLLATGLRGVVGLQEQVKTLQERLDRVEDVMG